MTNDPLYEQMRQISWRRKLTVAEEARLAEWLAVHPEAREDWESEAELNELLATLKDVPVASNFTARVVQTAEREASAGLRGRRPAASVAWWIRWVPRAGLVAAILAAGLLAYSHILSVRHAEWARSVATVSQVAAVPSPDVLNDFDAIAAMGSAPAADEELLKLMQ